MKPRFFSARDASTLRKCFHVHARSAAALCATLATLSSAAAATLTFNGSTSLDIGVAANWTPSGLPSVVAGDTAEFGGVPSTALNLVYSDASYAGGAGNPGVNLSVLAGQSVSWNLDSGTNTGSLRMNNLTIASGAGAVSLGNAANTFNLTLGGGAGTHTWTNDSGNAATVASDVVWGLGGGGAHTLAVGGSGNWIFNNIAGQGSGVLTIAKSGAGALTLNGANTYTGGTTISAGTLNINHASGIGNTATGGLTITGGTLDNTSAAAITTTAAKTSAWNGDFTFTGTKDLSLNNGNATIGGTVGVRTLTVSAGKFSTGLITAPVGYSLTKAGAGTYAMSSTANTSSIAGVLNITGGIFQTSGDLTTGGLTGSGILENGGTAAKWFFLNDAANGVFSGSVRDGAGARLGLVKSGAGRLDLTGAGNVTGDRFDLQNGTVRLTGSLTTGYAAGGINQAAQIGSVANQNGILVVDGGTLNASRNGNPSIGIGVAANSRGFLQINSGTVTSANEFHIGRGAGGFGEMTMAGGTVTIPTWFVVAGNNDRALLNQSGGTLSVTTNRMTVGAGGSGSIGSVNLSGGTFNSPAGVFVGENGTGFMTVSGTSTVNVGNIQFAGNATSITGIFNLNGGTINTGSITQGTGTGVYQFNFNGGLIKPTATNATFFANLPNASAYVHAGGANIDTSGFDVTVSEPLLAPTGGGVYGVASFTAGAGYVDAPLVTIARGSGDTTGTGATAIATVSGGAVTGIIITNPGVGYTATPVFTLTGGGATTAATVTGTTPGASVSGALNKSGNGILTLTGSNTYTGATNVTGGTLRLTGSADVNGSSGIAVNGTGAKLQHNSLSNMLPPVTVTNGSIEGSGVINSATVASSATNSIRNGTAGAPLTINSLTFNDAASVTVDLDSASAGINTTNLTTGAANGAGKIVVNANNNLWLPGTYDLISYSGSIGGVGFSEFEKGTITGLSGRQSATLVDTGNAVAVSIAGDNPVWTGALSNVWSTATLANPKNWQLITSSAATDYLNGDIVLFDDTPGSNQTISIPANVNPTSTTFNNTSVSYNLTSPGAFGITTGSVTLNGFGTVALSSTNTYPGGTSLNFGTLAINNPSAIGTGTLTIAGFTTLDNTSGSAVTLTTNNAVTINGDFTFNGANDLNLGTGAVSLGADRQISTLASKLTFGGVVSGAGFGITKIDPGTLELSGANTFSGVNKVKGGTLQVSGGSTGVVTSNLEVAPDSADVATVSVTAGTLNSLRLILGGNSANNSTPGAATLLQSGGTINVAQWFTIGSGNGTTNTTASGVFTMTGGTVNASTVGTQNMEVANFGGSTGQMTMSGSSALNVCNNASIAMGANNLAGSSSITQNGGNVTFYSNVATTVGGTGALRLGSAGTLPATSTYTYSLNGGTLTVPSILRNAGGGNLSSGVFNFNGGNLKAAAASATFMQGLTSANVQAGGAKIDDNGFAITIGQALLNGAVTDGGLVKSGVGTTTLTGSSTYNGPTSVTAGTLSFTGTGSINSSSGITVNGGKLLHLGTTNVAPAVSVTSGTVDGTGSLSSVTVADNAANVVANGNGTAGALTVQSLTFNDAATMNLRVDTTAAAVSTNTLTTGAVNGAGKITINVSNAAWTNGQTYNLISYNTLSGVGFSEFQLGTVTGLSARQSATLVNVAGNIALSIAGEDPEWTGASTTEWSTAAIASPKNWGLPIANTPTDFLNLDKVTFNDNATGTTVAISASGVSPLSTVFNNSTKNFTLSGGGTLGITSGTVTKTGTGAVDITAINTYTAGTVLQNGTLNLNGTSPIGTGVLTINGGALGNTSGAPVTLATNNLQTWAGDFSYTGPNNLNMGTGAVTLAGTGTARTVTVTAGTLTSNAIPVATPGYGLTKEGAGTLAFGGTAASTIAGDLTINGGVVQIGAQDFTATGLAGSGTLENGSATVRWFYLNNATDKTFAGVLRDGTGGAALGFSKTGAGTLTLTGANNYNDQTSVNQGKLVFSGTTNNTRTANVVGTTAGLNAILEVASGSTFGNNYNGGQVYSSSLNISTNATSAGVVRVLPGGTVTANRQIAVGPTGYGAYNQTGGTTSLGGFIAAGGTANGGVVNVTGGSVTLTTAPATFGYAATTALAVLNVGGTGSMNLNGAAGNGLWIGEVGTAVLNLSGSGLVSVPNDGIILGRNNAAANGVLNLMGGTAQVRSISKGTGAGTVNFHGGVLKANGANATFMQGLTGAYIYGGGAVIDTDTYNVTIAQSLQAPTNFGVSASGLSVSGGGYIEAPIVTITGGGGTGATAVANIDSNGNLTGITVTNPGTGYTSAPTFALVGGGQGNTGAIGGVANIAPVTTGGLTKNGTGTLSLTGANTYAGDTVVNAGTLSLGNGTASSGLADAADVRINNSTTTLNLNYTSTSVATADTVDEFYIDGVQQATGTWGAPGSGAQHTSARITGAGWINVTTGSASDPYTTWAAAKGLDDSDAAHASAKNADPDGDGYNNLAEFAFNGDPRSASNNGYHAVVLQDTTAPAGNELTLVVATRDGATFTVSGLNQTNTTAVDGLFYTIQGSLDMTFPGSAVSFVSSSYTAPGSTGFPNLTGTGWKYQTFRLNASEGLTGKGFLRAKVSE